jgi:ATP-dependent exoDNAse (exonuclease V) beta subunit
LEKEVDNLAPKHETESKLDLCLRQVSAHSKELAEKASLKDVKVLTDSKADVDEVTYALSNVLRVIAALGLLHPEVDRG